MNERNIKPSLVTTFYEMYDTLMKGGFKQRDILLLIQDRTKPKMSMTNIKIMLKALIQFEKDFVKFKKIIGVE